MSDDSGHPLRPLYVEVAVPAKPIAAPPDPIDIGIGIRAMREQLFQRQLDEQRELHEQLRKREIADALLAAIIRAAERRLSVVE